MWNKIDEVAPKEGCFLALQKSKNIVVANFDGKGFWQIYIPGVALLFQPEVDNITHWMPLPAPPTADNVEGGNLQHTTGQVQN